MQYDKLANRWILTELSVFSGQGFFECVAVSTTPDATGSYFLYAFNYQLFPDYPKLAVWSNAYYITFNSFSSDEQTLLGGNLCAYDRNAMLAGSPANQVCFQLASNFAGVLPADLDGATPPPAGSPEYFVNFGANSLNIWQMQNVNFAQQTANLTGPVNIPVAPFSIPCGGRGCIAEEGGLTVDSLSDRLMYRLAYRNFGDHESLVVNHSVTAGNTVGVRWYEIRNPQAPQVFQQATYAPDTDKYRWMGSAAMDHEGNLAVGYNISSTSIHPGIRLAGRFANDPPGTLGPELDIIDGGGSEQGFRWGDYTSLSLDPVDDCTLWYTAQYLKADGSNNWSTRVSSFKFPFCGQGPTFTLSVAPPSVTVPQGGSGLVSVSVASVNGFSSSTALSISGLPNGVTASFSPASVTPPAGGSASSNLSLSVSSTAATGTFTLTITGTSGGIVRTASLSLTIVIPPSFQLSVSPGSVTFPQGGNATATVVVSSLNGFSSPVSLSISGLPSGVTASFSPGSVTPPVGSSASSTLTLTASATATSGIFTVNIFGTSGSTSQMTQLTLNITVPDFTIGVSPGSLSLAQNSSGSATVTVGSVNGSSPTTSLSISGLPSGVTASFVPGSVTPPSGSSASSTLTLTASSSATIGSFTLTITGTAGSVQHTTTLSLTVNGPPPDFTLSVSPSSINVSTAKGSSSSTTVTVASLNGFSAPTSLSTSGLPSGVTASFAPATITPAAGGSASSTLTLTASSTATTGTFTVKITGTAGNVSHTANLTITVGNVPPPDFSLSVSPASMSLNQGASGNATVTVGSLNGFSSTTSLSISGLPSGVTGSFSPASITPPSGGSASSTLTLTASASATVGTFTLTITGTSASLSHSTTLSLTVSGGPDFSIGVSPNSITLNRGGSATASVTITSLNGFSSSTNLSISALPGGVTATFSPASVTPPANSSASSTLTITASSSATTGTFNLTITGTSGTLQRNTTLTLNVTAGNNPVPSISNISPSSVFSGGPDFTLTINGSGFVSSSVVNVQAGNTSGSRPATFVSSNQLTVQMTAADIANSGQIFISITNPTPGGGMSNTATLNVF